jgi:hypothetical protein
MLRAAFQTVRGVQNIALRKVERRPASDINLVTWQCLLLAVLGTLILAEKLLLLL